MSDSLLDQADALMRRRAFVAGANSKPSTPSTSVTSNNTTQEIPVLETVSEVLPVLTDVVDAQNIPEHPDHSTRAEPLSTGFMQTKAEASAYLNLLLMEKQAVLTREIETWLDEQMPQLVIRAMDGITDHLVALLANRARDDLLPRLEAALQTPEDAETDDDRTEE